MKKFKILVVSGYFPFPTMHGGAYDIWERIKGLKQLGHLVDLVYTHKTKPNDENLDFVGQYVDALFFVKRSNAPHLLFNSKPLQVKSRLDLKDVKLNQPYDFVILESEYVSEILNNKTLKATKLILRSHNDESLYFKSLAKSTTNIFDKLYYRTEAFKFKYHSKKIYSKVDRIWFISKKEEEYDASKKGLHLPPPIDISQFKKQKLDTKNVLFVGSLFMPNNIEALIWYLQNVHNVICKKVKDYRLIIAGSTGNISKQKIKILFNNYNQIDLILDNKNLEEFYAKSSIFINPMIHGAGVKIKSINAIVNGLPLVSTNIGCEGIGLTDNEMFLRANTQDEFISAIINLLANEIDKVVLVDNAQDYLLENNYLSILKKELSLD